MAGAHSPVHPRLLQWGYRVKLTVHPSKVVIESSFYVHQVPLPAAKKDLQRLALLSPWPASYELFDEGGYLFANIFQIFPEIEEKKLGRRKEASLDYFPLSLPKWRNNSVKKGTQHKNRF